MTKISIEWQTELVGLNMYGEGNMACDACPCSTGTIVTGACLGLPWVRRVEGWPGPEQDEGPGDILQGGHGAEIE